MIDKRLTTEISSSSFKPKMRASVIHKVDASGKLKLERIELDIGASRVAVLESEQELKHFFDLCLEVRKVIRDGKEQ